ncbi:unnamed protein product [Cylindrotheca closterium]|uniref:L-ornithine N(5)-oxygenase n=1 Tax=Cylindrotheca closterium TaxID=2856 RepID=A0AAD2G7H2_9STRA|nr:unnamed protein product [Cylindrotheca closterium]
MKATIPTLLLLWCISIHSLLAKPSHSHRDGDEEPICDSSPLRPLRIAVIGAGPASLFLCHALEKLIKEHGIHTKSGRKMEVTAFERSSHPGGLWQPRNNAKSGVTIYDNMWTNGPSFQHEFYDYTYEEHFRRPVDVYFPRKDVLDYILARVQQNTTDFFEKYVRFDTEVINVRFSNAKKVFKVTVKDLMTGAVTSGYYEKCIWAAGAEGVPNVPRYASDLEEFGFEGRVIHSSDMANFEKDVRGKRILLIGGGLSAEDLALQAIKCGVEKVFVAARAKFGSSISMTTAWPDNKVEVLLGWNLASITEDGESLILESVTYDGEYYSRDEMYDDIFLDDVDTIIFCTGYDANINMLENSLQKGVSIDLEYENVESPTVSEDWSMEENCMTSRLGDVQPSLYLEYESGYNNPMVYRGVLISNPNMMFLSSFGSETPLLSIDVSAHLLAGYLYGTINLPTKTEMQKKNLERFHHMMHNPFSRMDADYAYSVAIEQWMETVNSTERLNASDEVVTTSAYCFDLYYLHQTMVDANYPIKLVGPEGLTCPSKFDHKIGNRNYLMPKGLTELGDLFVSMDMLCGEHRGSTRNDNRVKDQTPSKSTYRDYTDGAKFRSLHTHNEARPSLDDMWVNL